MNVDPCLGEPSPTIRLKVEGLKEPLKISGSKTSVLYRHLDWKIWPSSYVSWDTPLGINAYGEIPGQDSWNADSDDEEEEEDWRCGFSWTARILSQDSGPERVLWEKESEEDATLLPLRMGVLPLPLLSPEELKKKRFLHNHSLLLELTINADFPVMKACSLGQRAWKDRPFNGPGKVLSPFLASGEDVDVTLVAADGKKVKAHKLILKAYSPVFREMVSWDWTKAKRGTIKIPGINGEALALLVQYIYADIEQSEAWKKTWLPEAVLKELMYAGEKYRIPKLKNLAAYGLLRKLNRENACKLVVFFEKYNMNRIVSEVCVYMASWINRKE